MLLAVSYWYYKDHMTLATHAVVGSATASLIPSHPVIGFCAGFMSHFLLDSIPHWDYELKSNPVNPSKDRLLCVNADTIHDIICVGLDFSLGILLSSIFLLFGASIITICIGIIAGTLPDAL